MESLLSTSSVLDRIMAASRVGNRLYAIVESKGSPNLRQRADRSHTEAPWL